MPDEAPEARPFLRPYTIVASVAMLVGGGVLGGLFFPEAWSLTQRVGIGVLTGASSILMVLANRYIGRSESI